MNIRSNPDTTLPAVTTAPLPSSRKIFATPDSAPDLRVPLREIILSEGAGEPNQHHRGRADLGALDLADGGLGNPGALGEVSQGPAAAVALEPQALGKPGA